jgi:hypothetical protein
MCSNRVTILARSRTSINYFEECKRYEKYALNMNGVFFTCFFEVGSKRFIIKKITEQNTHQMRSETRVFTRVLQQ